MSMLKESVKNMGRRCLPNAIHLQFGDYLGFVRQAPRKPASTFQFYRDFLSFRHQRQFFLPSARAADPQTGAARQFDRLLRQFKPKPLTSRYFYPLDDQLLFIHPREYNSIASLSPDYAHVLQLDLDRLPALDPQSSFGQSIAITLQSLRRFAADSAAQLERQDTPRARQIAAYLRRLPSSPPASFDEALQKILFYNGLLWQNRYLHNGLGRLDVVLAPYLDADLRQNRLTRAEAKDLLKDFIRQLGGEHTRFKSIKLIGDTGQVIMLGGRTAETESFEHDLTFLFLEVFQELNVTDPKCILRVNSRTSDDLWLAATRCIATGCGSPLLANEDRILPLMRKFGYSPEDSLQAAIGACWEPYVIGHSFDQTNISPALFPLLVVTDLLRQLPDEPIPDFAAFLRRYEAQLLKSVPPASQTVQFTPAPLLSLLFPDCLENQKDLADGGARYNFHGRQVVGLPNAINALLNVKQLVFDSPRFTLRELADILERNFEGREDVRQLALRTPLRFGSTHSEVVGLTRQMMEMLTRATGHHTINGRKTRIGFASSRYVDSAESFPASLDGRKAAAPVAAHIIPLSPDIDIAEALDFGAALGYSEHWLNGNVVDFIIPPAFLADLPALARILKHGIHQGAYEVQLNVLSHEQLKDAKAHPEKYPNLIIRVWGFSAYFCDLPAAYQDEFIRRTAPSCPLPPSP